MDSPCARVASIPGKGRGLRASRPIAAGEVIERAPVMVMPAAEWPLLSQTIVARYCFSWRDGTDDTALALGLCSLLNHSYTPNVYSQRHVRPRVIEFIALRDITEGEELTMNYHGEPDATAPVDFPVRK
ncbi:MAG: SET domain-containing protein [Actinomycetota bacterium]